MKRIFTIGFFLTVAGASHAQFSRPDTSLARSLSGQFVVHGLPAALPSRVAQALETNANYVELEPALLSVSSERIKQAVYRELGDSSPWRGKIHIYLRFARGHDDPVTILSERFRDGWDYRMELPQFVERQRFVRAFVQTLLMERANRRGSDRMAEIPFWLTEGLTQHLLNSSENELLLPPPRWSVHGLAIRPVVIEQRGRDPLESAQRILGGLAPLTLGELSWPTDAKLAGEAGELYRHSAQLFVTELLRLPDGRECLRTMLDELAGCYNWQTAFFRAFKPHFARQLDLEKWWSLQVVNFTGRDPDRLWTVEETWRKLDEVVRTPGEVRHAANELPTRADVPLQTIVMKWGQIDQTSVLETKLRDLELARLRAALEIAELIEDYRKVLGSYLRRRDQVGLILTSTTRDPNGKLKALVRETVKQLDALDARRAALKPTGDSPLPGLVEGKSSPAR